MLGSSIPGQYEWRDVVVAVVLVVYEREND